MTISFPDTIGKSSLEREKPFLTECALIMHSSFIQYKPQVGKHVNVTQWRNSFCQERRFLGQLQVNFNIIEVQIVSVRVQNNNQLVCIGLELYDYFSSTIVNYPF